MPILEPDQLTALRVRLVDRARVLRDDVERVAAERESPPTLLKDEVQDSGEQGEQRSREAVRAVEQDRDTGELGAIADALDRIDAGDYGLCVDCELEIPRARLEVQPAAARCVECQARLEWLERREPARAVLRAGG